MNLERVEQIADRRKRLAAADRELRRLEAKADKERALRDMAVIVAHLDQGVRPVTLYRDVLGCSRSLFNRIIQKAPAAADRPHIPNAERRAATSTAKVRDLDAQVAAMRALRDKTAVNLMNGVGDHGERVEVVTNAEVARILGVSTARAAQMRTEGAA